MVRELRRGNNALVDLCQDICYIDDPFSFVGLYRCETLGAESVRLLLESPFILLLETFIRIFQFCVN